MLKNRNKTRPNAVHRVPGGPSRSNGLPRLPEKPYDLEAFFVYVCELEALVLKRLDAIFESVRRSESWGRHPPDDRRAIRLPEVLKILRISKSTLYGRLKPSGRRHDIRLPQPFKLGDSARSPSAWWHDSVIEYLELCAQSRCAS